MNWSIKLRVVVDTNVFISGLLWGGNPGKILNLWLWGKFNLLMCPYLCFEIIDVYQKFDNPSQDIEKLRLYLETKTIKIIPKKKVRVCRDPKDNQILALCWVGQADFLITGDKDLLSLKEFKNTKIVRPKEFLKIIPF